MHAELERKDMRQELGIEEAEADVGKRAINFIIILHLRVIAINALRVRAVHFNALFFSPSPIKASPSSAPTIQSIHHLRYGRVDQPGSPPPASSVIYPSSPATAPSLLQDPCQKDSDETLLIHRTGDRGTHPWDARSWIGWEQYEFV